MPLHLHCIEVEEAMPEGDAEAQVERQARPVRASAPTQVPAPVRAPPFWEQPGWVAPVAFLAGFLTATLAVGLYAFVASTPG